MRKLWSGRFALLKNEKNRTKSQEEIFKVIQEANLEVSVAWQLRENFKAIFNCQSFEEAKKETRSENTGRRQVDVTPLHINRISKL